MSKCRIFIWGTGEFGNILFKSIDENYCEIIGAIDNNKAKQGTLWWGNIPIYEPDRLLHESYDYILVANKKYNEILEQCAQMQLERNKIKCVWNVMENVPFVKIGCFASALSDYYLSKAVQESDKKCRRLQHDNERLKWNLDFAIRREKLFEQEALFEYSGNSPEILSSEELLNQLIDKRCSVCRFGDGELELMMGEARPWFQEPDSILSRRLQEVFYSDNERVLIAISDNFGDLRKYTSEAAYYIRDYMKDGKREKLQGLLEPKRNYYDAYVSRPYLMYRDKSYAIRIFKKFKDLWKKRRILLVEGEYMRSGINNDLFDGVKELRRIICPSQNAFALYDEILNSILENVDDDDLVLLALGPTATVLAYDVALQGVQAVDLGQIDNEYEWFLAGEENRVEIPGKAVPEREDLHEVGACNDPIYIKQVIRRIGC